MVNKATSVVIFLCALCAPVFVSAQVVINEFLYDAAGTDTDQEYVELLNTGSDPVDLTKWKINDGSSHTLNVPPKNGGTGSITIAPGGYVLLVDNATNFLAAHAGLSGTVIDTVLSLSNISATIALTDDTGSTVSSVSYTKDQGGNGDGNSLQRAGANWIMAAPTMNGANATVAAPPAVTEDTASTTATKSSTSGPPVSSYVAPPVPTLFADAGSDRTVIVGADSEYDGRAYDRNDADVDHVRFSWNFGDGSTAEGASVLHHYNYPGQYAVVLSIAQNKTAVIDQFTVTAEPARLTFSANPDGSVSIGNAAGHDLDLSGWVVRSVARMFIVPDHSILLKNATLRIAQQTLGFYSAPETELDYPNGALALKQNESTPAAPTATAPAPVVRPESAPAPTVGEVRSYSVVSPSPVQAQPVAADAERAAPIESPSVGGTSTSQAAAAATSFRSDLYWWVALFLSALALGGVALFIQNMKAGEWDIVEETPDRE